MGDAGRRGEPKLAQLAQCLPGGGLDVGERLPGFGTVAVAGASPWAAVARRPITLTWL